MYDWDRTTVPGSRPTIARSSSSRSYSSPTRAAREARASAAATGIGRQYRFAGHHRFDINGMDGDPRVDIGMMPSPGFLDLTGRGITENRSFLPPFTATSAATVVSFTAKRTTLLVPGTHRESGFIAVDQLSVTAMTSTTAPEPATWALLGSGLVALRDDRAATPHYLTLAQLAHRHRTARARHERGTDTGAGPTSSPRVRGARQVERAIGPPEGPTPA